jgi:acetylornithine deacetylase
VKNLTFEKDRFLALLGEMIGHAERLQNSPDVGLIPEEALIADIVCRELKPHIDSGFIKVERLAGAGHEKRTSLVLTIQGTGEGTIGWVGAHFDVVPADREAEGWERDPFTLWVGEDGTVYGRGVTDCLGHIAVITDLLCKMGDANVRPKRTLKVVMIANEEEAPVKEYGLDYVVDNGYMDDLKGGPIYWLDSADFGPTLGTGGTSQWRLEVTGVTGHSGLTHNCVNALELAMASCLGMVEWFEEAYPAHAEEERYGFHTASTLKSTVVQSANNKITKIPGNVVIEGDFRLTPFYDVNEVKTGMENYVARINAGIESGDLPDFFPRVRTDSGRTGSLKLVWKGRVMEGIAVDLKSEGLAALERAIKQVRGEEGLAPFSMTGSLPLVRDLQRDGFDVQITGFGRSSYYHAPNEQANVDHFRQGFEILRELMLQFE